MSVYDELGSIERAQEVMTKPDALTPGQPVILTQVTQVESKFRDQKTGKFPMNLKAHFSENGIKYFLYMPTIFNNLSEDKVKQLNDDINKKQPPSLVYYGTTGNTRHVSILKYKQAINSVKFKDVQSQQDAEKKAAEGTKRKSSENDDETPTINSVKVQDVRSQQDAEKKAVVGTKRKRSDNKDETPNETPSKVNKTLG